MTSLDDRDLSPADPRGTLPAGTTGRDGDEAFDREPREQARSGGPEPVAATAGARPRGAAARPARPGRGGR